MNSRRISKEEGGEVEIAILFVLEEFDYMETTKRLLQVHF